MPILRLAITSPLPRHPDGVPRLPPSTLFSPPRVIHGWFGRHTRASKTREKEAERRRPIYRARTARLLSSNSFAWIHPILGVYVWNLQRVVQIVDWWEIIIVLFGGLWRNQVWKWHLARILGCVLEEEWFRIFDFYNEYLSKSDTRISTIFQKSGSERCLLMFNVSLRVSFAVKRRSRNRNLRDLCGNSHEPGCQRNIKDELKCSLEIREMYERLVWKIKSRP